MLFDRMFEGIVLSYEEEVTSQPQWVENMTESSPFALGWAGLL